MSRRAIQVLLAVSVMLAGACSLSGCKTPALSPERIASMDARENLQHWRDLKTLPVSDFKRHGFDTAGEYETAVWYRARELHDEWTDRDAVWVMEGMYGTGMHRSAVLYVLGWPRDITRSSGLFGGRTEMWSYGQWPDFYKWVTIGSDDRVTSWESSN